MSNFQRDGSISNPHVGREFEACAQHILTEHGILLNQNQRFHVVWELNSP